jgi:hypothetical protein
MAITLRTPTGLSDSFGTSESIVETAANPQPGDVRYLFVGLADNVTLTGPTGWTSVANVALGVGKLGLFRKNYVAGEGTATITFSASTYSVYHVISVAGANTAAAPQSTTNGGTTGSTFTATTITPSSANSLELVFFAAYNSTSGFTLTTPSGFSLQDSRQSPGSLGVTGLLVSKALPTTTATGSVVSTGNNTPQGWMTANVVIAPAAGTVKSGQFLPFFGGGL